MALVAVTPSDGTALGTPLKRIWAGVTGTVTVIDTFGNTVLLTGFPAGSWVPFPMSPIAYVKATGTTATGIVGDTNAGT
jgi:hypothetical protein